MKTAFLVIYNHRYDKNIEKIEKLYASKFSHIYHVIPFYDGDKSNVIPVFESSFCFHGYVAQAWTRLKDEGFTHFFFIADDMIINPLVNENNYHQIIGLTEVESYLSNVRDLSKVKSYWQRVRDAIFWSMEMSVSGAEIKNEIPSIDEAKIHFSGYNLNNFTISARPFLEAFVRGVIKEATPYVSSKVLWRFIKNGFKFPLIYPMAACYADISIIPEDVMPSFIKYAGAFAATGLFVEVAWSTALILSTPYLKTDNDTILKGRALWPNNGWYDLDNYNYSLSALLDDFPKNQLFWHPVKLSKWKLQ